MRRETEYVAQEVDFRSSELPAWIRRGGCAKRRRGGRLSSKTNSLLNLADRPVRSHQGGFATFSLVASTPPAPGGEFGRLKTLIQTTGFIAFISAFSPIAALAQEEEGPRLIQIPNPMAAHTWFIIAAVGAFLAWCISYVLQFRRNQQSAKSDKARRVALLHEKDELLDRLAQLESEKEAGTIPGPRYEKEYKKARSRLSDVLGRLGGKGDAGEA